MIQFKKLREEHLEKVLQWRTSKDVTRFMNTDIENNIDQQYEWFATVTSSTSERYWIVEIKGVAVGLISLSNIDFLNRRTSLGFYIGEEEYRLYGGMVPPHLYNYVFHELGLHKITAEVFCGNDNVIKLNKLHGCREVGIYKEHIYKYGQFHDVMLMELLKEDWLQLHRYTKYRSVFEV